MSKLRPTPHDTALEVPVTDLQEEIERYRRALSDVEAKAADSSEDDPEALLHDIWVVAKRALGPVTKMG